MHPDEKKGGQKRADLGASVVAHQCRRAPPLSPLPSPFPLFLPLSEILLDLPLHRDLCHKVLPQRYCRIGQFHQLDRLWGWANILYRNGADIVAVAERADKGGGGGWHCRQGEGRGCKGGRGGSTAAWGFAEGEREGSAP